MLEGHGLDNRARHLRFSVENHIRFHPVLSDTLIYVCDVCLFSLLWACCYWSTLCNLLTVIQRQDLLDGDEFEPFVYLSVTVTHPVKYQQPSVKFKKNISWKLGNGYLWLWTQLSQTTYCTVICGCFMFFSLSLFIFSFRWIGCCWCTLS